MGVIIAVGTRSFLAQNWISISKHSSNIIKIHHDELYKINYIDNISHVISFMRDARADYSILNEKDSIDFALIKILENIDNAKFIFLSSRLVYGRGIYGKLSEDSAVNPNSFYGENKYISEEFAKKCLGNRVCSLRISNVFGYETAIIRRTFMSWLLNEIFNSDVILVNCPPDETRDFIPVRNFVHALDRVIANNLEGIFNCGSGVGTRIGSMVEEVCGSAMFAGTIRYKSAMSDCFVLDVSRICSLIGRIARPDEILTWASAIGHRAKLNRTSGPLTQPHI